MEAQKTCERVLKNKKRCGRAHAHFWVHFGLVLCYACGTEMAEACETGPLARYGKMG